MKLRLVIAILFATLPHLLSAEDLRAQIAEQLRSQGYANVEITKTWLGRLRFEAFKDDTQREIIVNPRTGEILRDFQSTANGAMKPGVQILDRPSPARELSDPERVSPQIDNPRGAQSPVGIGPDRGVGNGPAGPAGPGAGGIGGATR